MSHRILVIDDDVALVRCLTLRLKSAGYQTMTAYNGFEGEQLARETPPDLVLLDMRMPQRDGLATLAALRQADETRNVPVLMLSGAGDERDRVCAAGAAGLLVKPCPAAELLAVVRNLVSQGSTTAPPL